MTLMQQPDSDWNYTTIRHQIRFDAIILNIGHSPRKPLTDI